MLLLEPGTTFAQQSCRPGVAIGINGSVPACPTLNADLCQGYLLLGSDERCVGIIEKVMREYDDLSLLCLIH